MLIAVPILVILLALFMTRTRLGLMVRAAASNSEKSRLMGIPVARTSTVVWGIAAAFTAVTIIVLASVQFVTPLGAANGTAQLTLGYPVLVKALLIAMVARMRILWLTIPVGIALGIVEVIFQQNVTGIDANVFALWLFVATLVVVLTLPRSMRVVTETGNSWKLAGRVKPLPERLRGIWLMRQLPRLGVVAALLVFAVIPAFAPQASQSFLWTRVVIFAIAGCSLTILSGWAGQLSLGQFGFSAIGGLVTVKMVTSGWFGVHNVPWGVAVTLGVLVGAGAAVLIGIPALRIPGLYLAVTTLAFAVFVENWLVTRRWLGIDELTGSIPVLQRPDAGVVNFSSRHSYYYLCLFFLAVCLAVLAQIRRSGIGRSIIAVRDNERSAETMTLSTTRAKLIVFAISGGIAALAGALYVTSLPTSTPSTTFATSESVVLVAIGVIGGLGSIVGPLLGAAWVIGLPTLFPDFAAAPLLVSSVGSAGAPPVLPRRLRRGRVPRARRDRRTCGTTAPARAGAPACRRRRRAGAHGARHARRRRHRARRLAGGRRRDGAVRGSGRGRPREHPRRCRRSRRPHRHQRRGQVDAHERDQRLRALPRSASRCSVVT